MREIGIDLSTRTPRLLTTEDVQDSEVVITMGCGDTCPACPGKTCLDWDLADPAGLSVEQVRPIREEIQTLVTTLADTISAAAT